MRNGFVDLIKLVFACIVCFYHFFNVISPNPYFPLGDLTVEIFVLIAGVFLFWNVEKQVSQTNVLQSPYFFLKKRFFRFLPYSFSGFLIAFVVKVYLSAFEGEIITLQLLNKWLSDGIWDVLMIKMNGMNDNTPLFNVPAWTLSAMLISEFVAFSCLYNNRKLFETLIVPLTIVIGLGVWRHIPNASHQLWMGFTTFGLFRVWIIYCLSWYCCKLMIRIRAIQWTKQGKIALTACEVLCYAFTILIIMNQSSRNCRWVATLSLFYAIAISISGRSVSADILHSKKLIAWIGELSMGIYLTHYPIMQVFRAWYSGKLVIDYFIPFLLTVAVASVLFTMVVAKCKNCLSRLFRKMAHILIEQPSTSD